MFKRNIFPMSMALVGLLSFSGLAIADDHSGGGDFERRLVWKVEELERKLEKLEHSNFELRGNVEHLNEQVGHLHEKVERLEHEYQPHGTSQ